MIIELHNAAFLDVVVPMLLTIVALVCGSVVYRLVRGLGNGGAR